MRPTCPPAARRSAESLDYPGIPRCLPGAGAYPKGCVPRFVVHPTCRRRGTQAKLAANAARPARRCGDERKPMSLQKPEDVIGSARPFTGAEYLESLRDGREVYIYGERVPDVTTHPAFRNAARTIAKLYDALHDPKQKDVLT